MRFCSIASGSSGNASYIGSNNTHILIDVGITKKRIETGLNELDLSFKDISAILITHEHIDHIKGLGVILRKYDIPVYTSKGTLGGILETSSLGDFDYSLINTIEADAYINIGDLEVKPFRVDHDANETYAFRIDKEEKSLAVATDLGCFNDYIINNLKNLDAMLIEANHDIRMLELGSYPYNLKRRILGDRGHLSNESSGKLICNILNDKLKQIFLGHLSSENNYPELALEAVKCEISLFESKYKYSDFNIEVAKKDRMSEIIEI